MRRFITVASFLLAVSLAGCTTDVDMANMRDNTLHSTQIQAEQVTTVQEQVDRLGAVEAERQRTLLRLNAALEELRVQQRTLRGELEELQYLQERADAGLDDRLVALDQRLRILETRPEMSGIPQDLGVDDLMVPEPGDVTEPPPVVVPPLALEGQGASDLEAEAEVPTPARPERDEATAERPTDDAQVPVTVPPSAPEQERRDVAEVVPAEPAPVPEPPRNDPQAARLFQRARDDYQQGNYEVAIILFKQYLRQHSRSPQAGDAQYWIGESLYAQKEFNAAIVAFDEVIQEYPQSEMVAASTLKVGLSFANLGDQPNARFFLQQVQENFPNSNEAQLATEKLKQLRR